MVHLSALNVANGPMTVGSFAYSHLVPALTLCAMPGGLTTRNAMRSYSRHTIRAFGRHNLLRCAPASAVFGADLHVTLQGEEQCMLNVANGNATVGSFVYARTLAPMAPCVLLRGVTTRAVTHRYSRHAIRTFVAQSLLRFGLKSAVFCADLHVTLQGEEQ